MTADEVEMLRATQEAAQQAQWSGDLDRLLGKAPERIDDYFCSVLGDGFHFMDRPKVPVHHAYKKPYFHALQEAWFAWEPQKLKEVTDALRNDGLSEEDIEAKMYHDATYFRNRVPRVVLPPSKLYPRVRAVFELYGPKIDMETQKPLFNKSAWAKASHLLQEILMGLASDPPGVQFYTVKLDEKGQPMLDCYGIAFINCNRGTNDTECVHKQIVTTFGTWNVGVELGDMLMAERRHRYNQNSSERHRLGFPKIGHYDSWLIDSLQILVEKNHGVVLYPEWSNASDYKATPEKFGTVPMHSIALQTAVDAIKLDVEPELSEELQYMCSAMGTKLPFLPVSGRTEQGLFARFILDMPYPFDYDKMAIDWCKEVDGVHVWPKLPVYLRTYHKQFQRNQRVKDAVRQAKTGAQKLKTLNQQTSNGLSSDTAQGRLPTAMPQASSIARRGEDLVCVGGTVVGGAPPPQNPQRRRNGERSADKEKRAPRRCRNCLRWGKTNQEAQTCKGRGPTGKCTLPDGGTGAVGGSGQD